MDKNTKPPRKHDLFLVSDYNDYRRKVLKELELDGTLDHWEQWSVEEWEMMNNTGHNDIGLLSPEEIDEFLDELYGVDTEERG